MEIKILSVIFKLFIFVNILLTFVRCIPTGNSQQTEVNEEVIVTAYPDTQKRFVDLSYVSPEVSDIIQKSNLNIDQIREQQEKLKRKIVAIDSDQNRYDLITSLRPPMTISSIEQTSKE